MLGMRQDLEELESFLKKTAGYASKARRSRSIFDVGGRGHYENPTSELLAFFLSPQEEHGLGSIFLDAFFDTLGKAAPDPAGVKVWRERLTRQGNRIDVLVCGSNWVLAIENKIRHRMFNPFDDYENYLQSNYPRFAHYLAVLSPSGAAVDRWMGVGYEQLIHCVEGRLNRTSSTPGAERWRTLAGEWLLNLRNQTTQYKMNSDVASFVETNIAQFEQAHALLDNFKQHCITILEDELKSKFPALDISVVDAGWPGFPLSFRCRSNQWSGADVVLFRGLSDEVFTARLYLPRRDDARVGEIGTALAEPVDYAENFPNWSRTAGGKTFDAGVKTLLALIGEVKPILVADVARSA